MRALLFCALLVPQLAGATTTLPPVAPPVSAPVEPSVVRAICDKTSLTLKLSDLLGQWLVQWMGNLTGEPTEARLVFTANPEFADSLLGLLDLGRNRHEIAGDLEEELLTLEESADGKSISANWSMRAAAGLCGKELTGTWIRASDGQQRQVVLRRATKW